MVKRRKKKHIHSTPEREKKTKAMKALWQTKHSQKSVTEFWRAYLRDLATEKSREVQGDPPAEPSEVDQTRPSQPKLQE